MANLSWLYYRGYYADYNETVQNRNITRHFKWGAEPKDAENESFFKGKNKLIVDSTFHSLDVSKEIDRPSQSLDLTTEYPGLLIGTGYSHGFGALGEAKIGFSFDYTSGMPIIPGHSVKGALRAWFPQFPTDDQNPLQIKWKQVNPKQRLKAAYIAFIMEHTGKPDASYLANKSEDNLENQKLFEKIHELELTIFEGLDVAESRKQNSTRYFSIYERDIFYEAVPKKVGKDGLMCMDSITPHVRSGMDYEESMLKNPTPLLMVKVAPEVTFHFEFRLTDKGLSKTTKVNIFAHILSTFGIGAKTNVGYGQFKKAPYISDEPELQDFASLQREGSTVGEVVSTGPLQMKLPMIKDYSIKHSIQRYGQTQYNIGDRYMIKFQKRQGRIEKIEFVIPLVKL